MKDHYRKVHQIIEHAITDHVYKAEEQGQEVAFSTTAGVSELGGKCVLNGTFLLIINIGPFHTVSTIDEEIARQIGYCGASGR
jgi:hypothetical protein